MVKVNWDDDDDDDDNDAGGHIANNNKESMKKDKEISTLEVKLQVVGKAEKCPRRTLGEISFSLFFILWSVHII